MNRDKETRDRWTKFSIEWTNEWTNTHDWKDGKEKCLKDDKEEKKEDQDGGGLILFYFPFYIYFKLKQKLKPK